jgi:hypothetical protein
LAFSFAFEGMLVIGLRARRKIRANLYRGAPDNMVALYGKVKEKIKKF